MCVIFVITSQPTKLFGFTIHCLTQWPNVPRIISTFNTNVEILQQPIKRLGWCVSYNVDILNLSQLDERVAIIYLNTVGALDPNGTTLNWNKPLVIGKLHAHLSVQMTWHWIRIHWIGIILYGIQMQFIIIILIH